MSVADYWLSLGFLSDAVPMVTPSPMVELYMDTTLQGWGSHVDSFSALGYWTHSKKLLHINRLELVVAFRAVFCTLSEGQGSSPLHRQHEGYL